MKKVTHQFSLPRRPLYPWLFCIYGSFTDPIFFKISRTRKGRRMRKRVSPLGNERVISCSPDGCWLLLAKNPVVNFTDHERYFAFNPTTLEYIDLPCVTMTDVLGDRIEYGVLSTSPTDSNCLLLLFVKNHPLILYCRVGDSCFSVFNYQESMIAQTAGSPDLQQRCLLRHPVGFNGKIYAIGSCDNDLVQITVDEFNHCNTCLINPNPFGSDSFPSRFSHTRKLLVSSGLVALGDEEELFQIHIFIYRQTGVLDIGIYKYNPCTNSWENTTSLNGNSMFLSSKYCLSVDDTPNKDWSYIYFTSAGSLFSYRVEDERLSYSNPLDLPSPFCYSLPSSCVMHTGDIYNPNQKNITTMHVSTFLTTEDMEKQQQSEQDQEKININCSSISVKKMSRVDFSKTKTKKRNRDGDALQPLLLCGLSKDVLGVIASKLSFVDYMNFRCVNKVCASSTIRTRMNPFPPSLIYCDRAKGVYNILDYRLNQKLSGKIPCMLKGYTIRSSKDGWLLMENNGAIAFFNPFTMETVAGPRCKESFEVANFTFLSNPSSSNCNVMVMSSITSSTGRFLGIYTAQPPRIGGGGGEWREFILQRENQPKFIQGCINPVFLNESWYYLGEDGRLGRLQSTKDKDGGGGGFEWEVLLQLSVPREPVGVGQNCLTECGGDLVSVLVRERGIYVFKLIDDQNWEQMNTLGSYSIYVSWTSSISFRPETTDMANRIYFPRFYKYGLVYYSLNTKKFHSHSIESEYSMWDFSDTSMHFNYAWIEPSWR